jgi:Family of unknown function (DUF6491)
MKRILLAAAVLLVVSGCAADLVRRPSPPALKYHDYAGPPIDDFYVFRFDGWEVVGRDELVVWTGLNEAYLLKVWDTCPDLEFALRIGVTTTSSRVSRFDKVRVGRERCPISQIQRIDIARLKADRAKAAREKAAPAGPAP